MGRLANQGVRTEEIGNVDTFLELNYGKFVEFMYYKLNKLFCLPLFVEIHSYIYTVTKDTVFLVICIFY